MNILIVNFDNNYNHGGVIQGWALQHVLQRMGHNVVKAEIPQNGMYPQNILKQLWGYIKRLRRRYFIGDKSIYNKFNIYNNDPLYIINHKVMQFTRNHINVITVNSMDELRKEDYDAVIVGSDQIWRRRYAQRHKLLTNQFACDNAFLAFTKGWDCKRIAYAASIGVDYWEYTDEETDVLRPLIKRFDAISVREDSAVGLLHSHLDPSLNIEHVLDPTLLVDKEDYIHLYQEKREESHKGEILVYILDPSKEKDSIISYAKENTGLKTFSINNPRYFDYNLSPKERIQTSMTSWLRGFHDASMIVTDSFHACVFSIIFEKPFYVILNEVRGATRIHSLLKIFGLQDRIIHSPKEFNTISKEINWNRIREIKKEWQKKSIDFLQKNLK